MKKTGTDKYHHESFLYKLQHNFINSYRFDFTQIYTAVKKICINFGFKDLIKSNNIPM